MFPSYDDAIVLLKSGNDRVEWPTTIVSEYGNCELVEGDANSSATITVSTQVPQSHINDINNFNDVQTNIEANNSVIYHPIHRDLNATDTVKLLL